MLKQHLEELEKATSQKDRLKIIHHLLQDDAIEKNLITNFLHKIKQLEFHEDFIVSASEFDTLRKEKYMVENISHVFAEQIKSIRKQLQQLESQVHKNQDIAEHIQTLANSVHEIVNEEEKLESYLTHLKSFTYNKKWVSTGKIISKLITKTPLHRLFSLPIATKEAQRKYIRLEGIENIPKRGPVIIAPHHHHAALDPIIIKASCPRPIFFLASTETFVVSKWYGDFMHKIGTMPITRDDAGQERLTGKTLHKKVQNAKVNNFKSIREVIRHLQIGDAVGIFPENDAKTFGETYPRESGEEFIDPKGGTVFFSLYLRSKGTIVPIIPVGMKYSGDTITIVYGRPFVPILGNNFRESVNQETTKLFSEIKRLSS